jgi:hypothetical protein
MKNTAKSPKLYNALKTSAARPLDPLRIASLKAPGVEPTLMTDSQLIDSSGP